MLDIIQVGDSDEATVYDAVPVERSPYIVVYHTTEKGNIFFQQIPMFLTP